MNEKIRALIGSEVPNLHVEVELEPISQEINAYIETLLSRINIQDLNDWRLLINVIAQRTDAIGVAKRSLRYISNKEFEIFISVPIPDNNQATYGLPNVKKAFLKPYNEKYSYILEPNFDSYDNLPQYIIESSKRAIDLAFTYGFTCNGKKIKFQK
jgi:hypothetical protein